MEIPRLTITRSALFLLAALIVISPFSRGWANDISFNETTEQHEARLKWWREARFGMFIHFGLYAIPGRGEWVQWNEQIPVEQYAKLADEFKPNFDPDSWAETAKAAGMKYTVLTSRHHDGFSLFDSKASDFTSMKTAAHRDIVAEYVTAVRKVGLHAGLYYSPLDWRFPGFFFPDLQRKSAEAMREQYHRQVEELLSNYGKIDVLWFDGGEADWLNFNADWGPGTKRVQRPKGQHYHGGFDYEHDKAYAMIRRLQPQIIINGRADMPEDFHSRESDQALGDFDMEHPWELCTTLAGAWGYEPNKTPKTFKHCIQLLAKVAGRDGNLLLNVGPRPDGQIDPAQVQRLREIGEWLTKNGESIYATRGGPFLPGDYGVSTRRNKQIYLHVLNWPGDKLVLPAIAAKIVHASVLTGGEASFVQTGAGIEISVQPGSRNDVDTVVALELDQSVDQLKPIAVSSK